MAVECLGFVSVKTLNGSFPKQGDANIDPEIV